LEHKLGAERTKSIFLKLRGLDEKRFEPNAVCKEIQDVVKPLAKLSFKNLDGFEFSVSQDCYSADRGFGLEPTTFVFDQTPGCSDQSILKGLWRHGPFDSSSFDNKTPSVLVVCHKNNRGSITAFLSKLRDGIPQSQYFQRGMKDLFRLHDMSFDVHEVVGGKPEDFEKAINRAIKGHSGNGYNIAVIEGHEKSKSFHPNNNTYYRAKACLMNLGIPVQVIKDDTFKCGDNQLQWTLGPVALQMYAKLGGVPWVLPASQTVDREIVVGIGSALTRPKMNMYAGAEQSRIVGLTTFFLGDGTYLMGHRMKDVSYDEYFGELLTSLKESIMLISVEYGWNKGDTVRIVFHVYKPIKNIEADVVEELVSSYSDYQIKFAFITVSENHPYMMWKDEGNGNLTSADRGDNLVLNSHECLLQTKGKSNVAGHKFSDPVLVKIHEKSTYQDLFYISQQILNFSYMSWRSFSPSHIPVTIFYSQLMARLSAKLRQVDSWNPQVLDAHFRRKKWFL